MAPADVADEINKCMAFLVFAIETNQCGDGVSAFVFVFFANFSIDGI